MASWHQNGGIPLLLFLALTLLPAPGLSQTCAEYQTTLCTGGTLLKVFFKGGNVRCDQELPKPETEKMPTVSYPQAKDGTQYLLVMTDPDAPFPCAPSVPAGQSFLHLVAVMERQGGQLQAKSTPVGYQPPTPPQGTHRYQLRLFQLQGDLTQDLSHTARQTFQLQQLKDQLGLGAPVAQFQFKVAAS